MWIFCSKLLIAFFPKSIERSYLIVGLFVETYMRKQRIFNKQNRHIGVFLADYVVERHEKCVDLLDIDVGHAVENNKTRIGNSGYDIGDFKVELSVTAETKVDNFAIKLAGKNIAVSHARAIGTSTLKDASSIHYDRT